MDADTKQILEKSRDDLHEAVLSCDESRRLLEDIAELEDETADIAYLRKDNVELQVALRECKAQLAAAEARIEDAMPTIQAIGGLASQGKLDDPGGEGSIIDLVRSAWKALSSDHEALDAALEQARVQVLHSLADLLLPNGWADCGGRPTVTGLYAEITKRLMDKLEQARAEGAAEERERQLNVYCEWRYHEDYGYWQTSCGNSLMPGPGMPRDNDMAFCPYCGAILVEQAIREADDD